MTLLGQREGTSLRLGVRELEGAEEMEDIFHRIAHAPYACFLDSSLVMERLGRHSFIAFDPHLVLTARGPACRWWRRGEGTSETRENPFGALRRALGEYRLEEKAEGMPPFLGGGMGYLAYELGRRLERLPEKAGSIQAASRVEFPSA